MASSENNRIFKWKDFSEWKLALEGMFKDILTPELKAKLKKNRAIVEYCDDPEPFEKLAEQSIEAMITAEKINEFRLRYSHIRVYHGCRPRDVQSYYKKGVLPSIEVKESQVDRFRELFLSGKFPELTEEMLQESIKEVGSKEHESSFDIDDRFLLEHFFRRLIYGSEYLCELVNNLRFVNNPPPIENIEKYRSVLRGIGKPALLKINLPNTTEYVDDNTDIRCLIRRMITEWTSCVAYPRAKSSHLGQTFELSKRLPPEYIRSHKPPKKIRDRLVGKIYNTETLKYEDAT